jgi:hypothetical protein
MARIACTRIGVAAPGLRPTAHADQAYADGRAKCCEPYVKAAGQFR